MKRPKPEGKRREIGAKTEVRMIANFPEGFLRWGGCGGWLGPRGVAALRGER